MTALLGDMQKTREDRKSHRLSYMTERRVGVSSGIGLRDPRSQKGYLGHPSVSPSDIAETIPE
jgi:hypothetical protein